MNKTMNKAFCKMCNENIELGETYCGFECATAEELTAIGGTCVTCGGETEVASDKFCGWNCQP